MRGPLWFAAFCVLSSVPMTRYHCSMNEVNAFKSIMTVFDWPSWRRCFIGWRMLHAFLEQSNMIKAWRHRKQLASKNLCVEMKWQPRTRMNQGSRVISHENASYSKWVPLCFWFFPSNKLQTFLFSSAL